MLNRDKSRCAGAADQVMCRYPGCQVNETSVTAGFDRLPSRVAAAAPGTPAASQGIAMLSMPLRLR